MATAIDVWQINDKGKFIKIDTTLAENNRTEPKDLETWLANNSDIISKDIRLIGRQITTKSGELDLLGIDTSGNIVIIELKRDKVPRDALAQAIDYASDISNWDIDKISEECIKYTNLSLEDYFTEQFPNVDIENIVFNSIQRILLVGFLIEEPLQRMIEWLFNKYSVAINAITLKYIKTSQGEELLAKTSIFDEIVEKSKSNKKFVIPKSDVPGSYDNIALKQKISDYFKDKRKIPQAIKTVLFPLCLKNKTVTRDMLKQEIVAKKISPDLSKSFTIVANISTQMGMEKNDFLRQLISYSYPVYEWEKDNYTLNENYRNIAEELIK